MRGMLTTPAATPAGAAALLLAAALALPPHFLLHAHCTARTARHHHRALCAHTCTPRTAATTTHALPRTARTHTTPAITRTHTAPRTHCASRALTTCAAHAHRSRTHAIARAQTTCTHATTHYLLLFTATSIFLTRACGICCAAALFAPLLFAPPAAAATVSRISGAHAAPLRALLRGLYKQA